MITKTTPLKKILELGNECTKCGHCCKHGSGCLAKDDIKNIAKFLKISEEELKTRYLEPVDRFNTRLFRPKFNKPFGKCIFFDEKCTIHKVKPLECKTSSYKSKHGEELSLWFMLNYCVNPDDPESVRQFASYLELGGKTLPGGKMHDIIPSKTKLKKILSYEVLK